MADVKNIFQRGGRTGSSEELLAMNKALYERLLATPGLDGTLSFNNRWIEWRRNCKACLEISWEVVNVRKGRLYGFHWHPEDCYDCLEEFYRDLVTMGTRGNILVIGSVFLCESVLYSGPAGDFFSDNKLWKKCCRKTFWGDEKDFVK